MPLHPPAVDVGQLARPDADAFGDEEHAEVVDDAGEPDGFDIRVGPPQVQGDAHGRDGGGEGVVGEVILAALAHERELGEAGGVLREAIEEGVDDGLDVVDAAADAGLGLGVEPADPLDVLVAEERELIGVGPGVGRLGLDPRVFGAGRDPHGELGGLRLELVHEGVEVVLLHDFAGLHHDVPRGGEDVAVGLLPDLDAVLGPLDLSVRQQFLDRFGEAQLRVAAAAQRLDVPFGKLDLRTDELLSGGEKQGLIEPLPGGDVTDADLLHCSGPSGRGVRLSGFPLAASRDGA